MLPKAEECDLDWADLTDRVMKRKEQLMSKLSTRSSERNGRSSTSRNNGGSKR